MIGLSIYNILLTVKLLSRQEHDCPLPQQHSSQFQHMHFQANQPVQPAVLEELPEVVQQVHQEQIQRPQVPPEHMQPCVDTQNKLIEAKNDEELFESLNLKLGRWDNRLLYKFYDNFLIGDSFTDLNEKFSVCLATQSSLDKLSSLVEVSQMWHGAISAALFAAGEEELNLLMLYIIYLRQCFDHIKQRVNFHLALPKDRIPDGVHVDVEELTNMDCNTPDITLKMLTSRMSSQTTKWRIKNPYPQNHLRNLARKNCGSKHVFLTDVDIIPSHDFVEKLDTFLNSYRCTKNCAYVIPTYELDNRVKFPANKTELVRLANKGLARPFHHRVFIYNQYATNFTKWQNNTQSDMNVHVSHKVTNFEFLYEPFYVAVDTVPPHDERFIGYGYTRNTQVWYLELS